MNTFSGSDITSTNHMQKHVWIDFWKYNKTRNNNPNHFNFQQTEQFVKLLFVRRKPMHGKS